MDKKTLSLEKFIKPVPVCSLSTTISELLAIFHPSKEDLVVVVSEQQFPLGAIALHSLTEYLFQQPVVSKRGRELGQKSYQSSPAVELTALVEPIMVVSGETTLSQLWQQLQTLPLEEVSEKTVAVVNSDGKFLGLLDSWLLLTELLPKTELETETKLEPETETSAELCQLLELIEQLPLPLMVENNCGLAIAKNSTWRSQLGEIDIEPEIVTSNCEGKLAKLTVSQESAAQPVPGNFVNRWCNLTINKPITPYCQIDSPCLGNNLCHYQEFVPKIPTMKVVGETVLTKPEVNQVVKERFWQFVKLPLARNTISEKELIWLVVATEVTEQQQLCKELAAKNADLVQLNRLKDEFLSCISHELKSPLTAVVGLSSLLKDEALGQLNQRQARYTKLIYQSGRQLMALVNDILDLTRLETGQLKLTPEPVQITNVCDRAYEQALQLQSVKQQQERENSPQPKFTREIEPGLEMLVADELRLRQMLAHLLDNAFKFTQSSSGGEIGLKVSRWEGWIAFTVWDTGIGIPAAKQHLIFQKFQQLENPLTRKFEGTGLGLVLTQRLARAHGGDVSFISKVGRGSNFTILLPPKPASEVRFATDDFEENLIGENPSPSKNLPSRKVNQKLSDRLVLIVEAVPGYIEQLTTHLRSLGYRVAIARSGTEALEKARSLQPRAILLNPLLPLLSGWDVLTLLKADVSTKEIPAIVTATGAEKQQAQQNGADGFLTLPVEKPALREQLSALNQENQTSKKNVTILRLIPQQKPTLAINFEPHDRFDLALESYSSGLNYRIVEAEDLEQAEILARVWHPDVVLLDSASLSEPEPYLENLAQHKHLGSLPLVTLDAKTTQAANQIQRLSVFPCLVPISQSSITALLEAIGVAAEENNRYNILLVDTMSLGGATKDYKSRKSRLTNVVVAEKAEVAQVGSKSDSQLITEQNTFGDRGQSSVSQSSSEWLQAVIQYLQTAGYRSSVSLSWTEIYSQIQHQSVDLLVFYLEEKNCASGVVEALRRLSRVQALPTILVLDRRSHQENLGCGESSREFETLLREIATKVIRGHSLSMANLLEQINQLMVGN
ncbi:ATP-binding response regulator [Oscillatoria salina]|uniref:ATP-binding response regulator n=1 Tax=Oscillatoria salina TaxID=331517 RepID=UPI0013BB02D5|nr:hybrid sensor histidine kinase/response regulator [Oscillatoria salina]MBZ8182559.1 hybrid sensor histidine kinase/response regulator [Oscillatoria salina IIICB1]NET88278.1 hybrid sensor histidine kinase/response regulator [Kamptonema sp. SIO1D9]